MYDIEYCQKQATMLAVLLEKRVNQIPALASGNTEKGREDRAYFNNNFYV